MKKAILLGLLLVSFVGFSQELEIIEEKNNDEAIIVETLNSHVQNDSNKIYTSVETMPEYPGGINTFRQFIAANYNIPKANRDIKGTLIINFVIEPDGSMSNIKVVRDLGFGTGFEAVRVLKLADKWIPGIQNGRPVRVNYSFPIKLDIKVKE